MNDEPCWLCAPRLQLLNSAENRKEAIMIRCWSCGTEHEYPASSDAHNREIEAAYAKGYAEGYKDFAGEWKC